SLSSYHPPSPPDIYPPSLHDALPIWRQVPRRRPADGRPERALVPGGHPVHRRQVVCGVAEEPGAARGRAAAAEGNHVQQPVKPRSEEHTSELQSLAYLVCRLLLEKKK